LKIIHPDQALDRNFAGLFQLKMAKTEIRQHAVPVTIESTTANDDSMDYTSTAQSLKYLIEDDYLQSLKQHFLRTDKGRPPALPKGLHLCPP